MRGVALLAFVGLAACTATEPSSEEVTAKLRGLTAQAVSVADPSAIAIEHAERFPAKWQWRATFNGRSFACDSDEQFRVPSCSELNGQT